jgi:hypothetical protein
MRTLIAFVVLCAPAVAAPVPKELRKEIFVGNWKLVSVRLGLQQPIRFKEITWTIGEDESLTESPLTYKDEVKLTPPQKLIFDPKNGELDVVLLDQEWLGIYRIEGDWLTICLQRKHKGRPDTIKASETTRIITLRRVSR